MALRWLPPIWKRSFLDDGEVCAYIWRCTIFKSSQGLKPFKMFLCISLSPPSTINIKGKEFPVRSWLSSGDGHNHANVTSLPPHPLPLAILKGSAVGKNGLLGNLGFSCSTWEVDNSPWGEGPGAWWFFSGAWWFVAHGGRKSHGSMINPLGEILLGKICWGWAETSSPEVISEEHLFLCLRRLLGAFWREVA